MILDVQDYRWRLTLYRNILKLTNDPQHLWFGEFDDFFLLLLTIKALCSTVLFQKLDTVFMALIKRHHGELFVTSLHKELPFHESLMDSRMDLWNTYHIFQEDWRPSCIVCLTKGEKPRAHFLNGFECCLLYTSPSPRD